MSKFVFLDANVFSQKSGELIQQNILLKNGVWIGSGYLPDDEKDLTAYSVKNCLIFPNLVDSYFPHCGPVPSEADSQQFGASAVLSLPSEALPHAIPSDALLSGSTQTSLRDSVQANPFRVIFSGNRPNWLSELLTIWHCQESRPLLPLWTAISKTPYSMAGLPAPKWGLLSTPSFSIFSVSKRSDSLEKTVACVAVISGGRISYLSPLLTPTLY